MRGKLRDKRTDARRDRMKRDLLERRRPIKRDNRMVAILSQQLADDYLLIDEEEMDEAIARQKN